jgi:hypothetical protein
MMHEPSASLAVKTKCGETSDQTNQEAVLSLRHSIAYLHAVISDKLLLRLIHTFPMTGFIGKTKGERAIY